jgi:hypothetical protein
MEETRSNLPGLIWGLSSTGNNNQPPSVEVIEIIGPATPPSTETEKSPPTIIQDASLIETTTSVSSSAKLATRRVVSAPHVLINRDRKLHYSERHIPTVTKTEDYIQENDIHPLETIHLDPSAASQSRLRRSSASALVTPRLATNQQNQHARKYSFTEQRSYNTIHEQNIIDIVHSTRCSNEMNIRSVPELVHPSDEQRESVHLLQGSSQVDTTTRPWTVYDTTEKRSKPFSSIEESILRSPSKMYQNPAFAQGPSPMTSTLDNLLKDLQANPLSLPGPPPAEPLPPLPTMQNSHLVSSDTAKFYHHSSSAVNLATPVINHSTVSTGFSTKKPLQDPNVNVSVPKNLRSVPLKRLAHRRLESITEENSFRSSDGRSIPNSRSNPAAVLAPTHTISDAPHHSPVASNQKARVRIPRSTTPNTASTAHVVTSAQVAKIVPVPPRTIGQVEFRDGIYHFKERVKRLSDDNHTRKEGSIMNRKQEKTQLETTGENAGDVNEDDTIKVRSHARVGSSNLSTKTK